MGDINARLVIELMGRPPEHIAESLNTLVVRMGAEKGVKIVDKKYNSPTRVKDTDNLFIAFAEVEAEFETLESFFGVVLNYMPANIEIFSPDKIKMSSHEVNSLSNFMIGKLHNYDAIAKRLIAERNILVKKVEDLTGKNISEVMVPNKEVKKKEDKEKPAKKKGTKKKSS
jgi:hypothetical protein